PHNRLAFQPYSRQTEKERHTKRNDPLSLWSGLHVRSDMNSHSFFRRYFLFTLAVFGIVLALSVEISNYYIHISRSDMFRTQRAEWVSNIEKHKGHIVDYLNQVNDVNRDMDFPMTLDLVRDGKSLLSGQAVDVTNPKPSKQRTYVVDVKIP